MLVASIEPVGAVAIIAAVLIVLALVVGVLVGGEEEQVGCGGVVEAGDAAVAAGVRSAAVVSMLEMRPLATLLCTITACAMFAAGNSAEYRAPPVTFRRPSTRSIGAPTDGDAPVTMSSTR